jgi:hypothetical protein
MEHRVSEVLTPYQSFRHRIQIAKIFAARFERQGAPAKPSGGRQHKLRPQRLPRRREQRWRAR